MSLLVHTEKARLLDQRVSYMVVILMETGASVFPWLVYKRLMTRLSSGNCNSIDLGEYDLDLHIVSLL